MFDYRYADFLIDETDVSAAWLLAAVLLALLPGLMLL